MHSVELDAKPTKPLVIPKYTPIGDRIVIQPDTVDERTASGLLILPDQYRDRRQQECSTGRVVARGPGLLCMDGSRFPMPEGFQVGDHVLYYNHGTVKLPLPEGDYVSIRDDFLIGVVEEGKYEP